MSQTKVRLTSKQIKYIMEMLEIDDAKQAMQEFATMMMEENLHPNNMPLVIDKIMEKQGK